MLLEIGAGRGGTINQRWQILWQKGCPLPDSLQALSSAQVMITICVARYLLHLIFSFSKFWYQHKTCAGDNFYPNGLNSSDDALFSKSFTSVYSQPSLKSIPWYAVLGNHDYGDGFEYCHNDAEAPCNRSPSFQARFFLLDKYNTAITCIGNTFWYPKLIWFCIFAVQLGSGLIDRDNRWNCNRFYTKRFGSVELFFIDTSPFIERYRLESWAKYPGGILEQSWVDQLKELEVRLSRSNAAWKIVVGHHPPRSNGDHGNNKELMQYLEPILYEWGVQIYFSGHDHDLEHLYVEKLGINYFVSGGGSQCDRNFVGNASSLWQYPRSGFLEAQVHRNKIMVAYYTLETKNKAAYSTVITLRS